MNSADIVRELHGARPVASQALRSRIQSLEPAPVRARAHQRFLSGLTRRRGLLIAVPAAALVAVAAAGITGALENGSSPSQSERLGAPSTQQATAPDQDASTTSTDQSLAEGAVAKTALVAPTPGAATGQYSAPQPAIGRAERYAAQLTLEVKNGDAVSAATQRALRITRDLGGYIVSTQVSTSEVGSASLILRVPHARAQEAITRLTQLGTIVSQNVQTEDLQDSLDALTKRITHLRAQLAAINARLLRDDLDSVERVKLEARRDAVRGELIATTQGKAATTAEAQTATIQLDLRTPESSGVAPVPSTFDRSIGRALEILAWEAIVVLMAALVLAPLGLVGLLGWVGLRSSRRRSDARLLEA
jgi:Domain of unknown function (DUF4349)